MRSPSTWTIVLLFSCLLTWFVIFTDFGGALRFVVITWFLCICPGMMLARFLRWREPLVVWTVAVTLSFAADTVVGGLTVILGKWSPIAVISILVIATVLGALLSETGEARAAWRAWR